MSWATKTIKCHCVTNMLTFDSGSWQKREGRPKEGEVLTSRLVDRPLRPMFAPGWSYDTQVGACRTPYRNSLLRCQCLNGPAPAWLTQQALSRIMERPGRNTILPASSA